MGTKKLCFRFDVDTHKCAKVGIPQLLDLALEKKVLFTFFINCGRAIDLAESIKSLSNKKTDQTTHSFPRLSARRKFGNLEYLRCAILNPQILKYAEKEIRRAHSEGHEIGLHGGRNHELWGRFVHQWTDEQIRQEVQWGLDQLQQIGIEPTSFASPCAEGGERVRKIVGNFTNFKFISDNLNPRSFSPTPVQSGILDLPTSLCGEGGVAYIEQLVAIGKNADEIVQHFESRIKKMESGIFYDHPYFAGDEAITIMGRLVDCAIDNGFELVTLTEIGHQYENHFPRKSS